MSSVNGKVRPDWMGDTRHREQEVHPEEEEQQATAVSTAPHPNHSEEEPATTDLEDGIEGSSEGELSPEEAEPHVAGESASYEDSARDGHDGYSAAPSSGKEDFAPARASERSGLPAHGAQAAPQGIKRAILSFVGKLREARSGFLSSSGAGSEATPGEEDRTPDTNRPQHSPEEVEQRLTRALRETSVEGFCRFSFGSPKGGVGKSSIAYAVAGALAYFSNLRVALVDADPNFGATRYMVPRPVGPSVLDLANDADQIQRLADLRSYVSQDEQMGLDVLLGPLEADQMPGVDDLADAYEQADAVLSRFYDVVIYDLGLGFRDSAIRRLLSLSDELVFVSDAEKIPNAQLPDALRYVERLGVDLSRTTLAINHGRIRGEESAETPELRTEHAAQVRRITEIDYDPAFGKLLNDREFHPAKLDLVTRCGVLTTAAAALEGLRRDAATRAYEKVISLQPDHDTHKGRVAAASARTTRKGGR